MSASDVIRHDIKQMSVYKVTDVPEDCIKLDAMESPYEYPEELKEELASILSEVPLNRYLNPLSCGIREIIYEQFNIQADAQVVLGNGSDELIQFLTLLIAKPGAKVLSVEPSFVMYERCANLYGLNYVGVPLNPDFTMDLDATLAAIQTHQPAITFLAYPNNPTGGRFERSEVEAILAAATGIVVVDQAYGAFASDSFFPQAGQYDNLVVLKTLSKIGFAGIRMGFAAGPQAIMQELQKIMPPYNMNQLSVATAKFAVKYPQFISGSIDKLKSERERMRTAIRSYDVIEDFASEANFLTIRVPDAQKLYDTLLEHKILIKNLHGVHPLLDQCVRITVGLPEENQAVLDIFQKMYES